MKLASLIRISLILLNLGLRGMGLACDDANYDDALPGGGYHQLEQLVVDGAYQIKIKNDHKIRSVALSPDGNLVAIGDSKKVSLRSAATGKLVHAVPFNAKVLSIAWSKDSKRFATGSDDNKAKLVSVATGESLLELELPDVVGAVALSPNGKKLAAGSRAQVSIFDTTTGDLLLEVDNEVPVYSLAFSTHGKRLAIGTWFSAKVICALTGTKLLEWWHVDPVHAVAFSPHAEKLATESGNKPLVNLYSTKTGKYIGPQMHEMKTWARAFSPDGKQFASCPSDDDAIMIKIYKLSVLRRIEKFFANATPLQEKWLDMFDSAIREHRLIIPTPDQWKEYRALFPKSFKKAFRPYIKQPEE